MARASTSRSVTRLNLGAICLPVNQISLYLWCFFDNTGAPEGPEIAEDEADRITVPFLSAS